MKTQTIEKLVQIINGKVTRKLFSNIRFGKDVLSNRNSAEFSSFFNKNGVIDSSKVFENGQGVVGQFHSFMFEIHNQ